MARKQEGEPSVPEAAKPAYDAIVALTDGFCQAHFTHEYQMLCRKLAAALARKRPSPLTRGKPEVWACAVRAGHRLGQLPRRQQPDPRT